MNFEVHLFYFLGAIAIVASLGILMVRNILSAAFLLVLAFFAVGGIYVLGNASFIGVTQLLIYVGGILVLLIFGIMLTNKLKGEALITETHNQYIGVLIGALFFGFLTYIILSINFASLEVNVLEPENTIRHIAISIMSKFLVQFELAGLLLLVALIGAIVISERKNDLKA